MSVFDKVFGKVVGKLSEWIQINDDLSEFVIDDFSYKDGVNEEITKPHCWKCVTVNKCWFKNEEGKKPEKFDYSDTNKYIKIILKKDDGIYHPHCHCYEKGIKIPTAEDIELIIPDGKIQWMLKDKGHTLNSMGYYSNEEFYEALEIIKKLCKMEYSKGNYNFREHNNTGYKIGLVLNFPGKHEDFGKIYRLKTGWTIFSNGKLKCNTLIGGLKWNI